MKFWVRENGCPPFHGPFTLSELAAELKAGRFSEVCEVLEANGQSYGALKRATGWTVVQDFELPDVPASGSSMGSEAPPSTAQYSYRVVPLPVAAAQWGDKASVAASYFGRVVGQLAAEGWDFYRVDAVGVRPGCLGALFAQTAAERYCYVVTFRKPNPAKEAAPNQPLEPSRPA